MSKDVCIASMDTMDFVVDVKSNSEIDVRIRLQVGGKGIEVICGAILIKHWSDHLMHPLMFSLCQDSHAGLR